MHLLGAKRAIFRRDSDLAKFPESRRIFQRDGNYYQPGDIFRQPDLARTLERIAAKPDDFYHGTIARELAADDTEGRRNHHRGRSGAV